MSADHLHDSQFLGGCLQKPFQIDGFHKPIIFRMNSVLGISWLISSKQIYLYLAKSTSEEKKNLHSVSFVHQKSRQIFLKKKEILLNSKHRKQKWVAVDIISKPKTPESSMVHFPNLCQERCALLAGNESKISR